MNENDDLDNAINKLPLKEKILYKGLIKRLKGGGRSSLKFVMALEDISKVIGWSGDAQKLYWDAKQNQPKENPNYDKAINILDNGINMLDKILIDFPTTSSTIYPMKLRLMTQLIDIENLKRGVIKTQSELEAEASRRINAMATP